MSDDSLSLFPHAAADASAMLKSLFEEWVESRASQPHGERASRELNDSSAKVYREMWFAFADFCGVNDVTLENIAQSHILAFLQLRARGEGNARMLPKGLSLSPRYAWRMLTLIDRITAYAAGREGRRPNRAARELLELPEFRYANARQKDPLPEYYTEAQAQQLITHLETMLDPGSSISLDWKEVRDRSAVGLMLGAGLAPGDIRAATVAGVFASEGVRPGVPWKISLPGNGNAPARETPIAGWAGALLAHWIKAREAQGIPGDLLFPSTLSGKPLSHATCYKVCKAVLEDAGMDDENGGIFKLRHTFALRQLADGKNEVEVARWLGLVDLNGMARYRKIVMQPVDLV